MPNPRAASPPGLDPLACRVAAAVRDLYPASRAGLARRLRLSPATITRVVDRLIQAGILVEDAPVRAAPNGRPAAHLRLNPRVATLLAADLRLTEAYVALVDLDGEILYRVTEPLAAGDPRESIEQLGGLLRQAAAAAPDAAPGAPVRAAVVGAPSIVDPATGLVEWAPSLGWTRLPLGPSLAGALGLPVRVENDVNLAALGEYWKAAPAHRPRHMVFVSAGTGIGAGILIDGRLYHGATSAAGEVGYFITGLDALREQAGQMGSLEARVGREGTLRRASLVAQRYPASALAALVAARGPHLHAAEIFALAQAGDPAAAVIFNETVDLLTIVISNLAVVLDPEVVVLGGPSDWQWQTLVDEITDRIGASLLRPIHLRPSRLGRDAVLTGAAYLGLTLPGVLADGGTG